MGSFNNNGKIGFKFTLEKPGNGKIIYMLSVDEIVWDSIKQIWKAQNYYECFVPETMSAGNKQLTVGDQSEYKETLVFGIEEEVKIDFHPKEMCRV